MGIEDEDENEDDWRSAGQEKTVGLTWVYLGLLGFTGCLGVWVGGIGDVPRVVGIGGGSPAVHQTGWAVEIRNNQPGEPTMRKYKTQIEHATQKAENTCRLALEAKLPMSEPVSGARGDIETFAAHVVLHILHLLMNAEMVHKVG